MLRQRLDWVTLEVSSHLDGSVNTVRLGLKGRRRFGRAGRAAKKKWRAATEQVVQSGWRGEACGSGCQGALHVFGMWRRKHCSGYSRM